MIKIICIGKIKEKFFVQAINEYVKRLKKYTKIEIIELQDESIGTKEQIIKNESQNIINHISPKDYVVLLDVKGVEMKSEEFADRISRIYWQYPNIIFIIGGSYGVAEELKYKSQVVISFSKLTFPHQLFRIILLEQIYRAYRIINNETYHK